MSVWPSQVQTRATTNAGGCSVVWLYLFSLSRIVMNLSVSLPSENVQLDLNIIPHIPELAIMKEVLFAVMLDLYGD